MSRRMFLAKLIEPGQIGAKEQINCRVGHDVVFAMKDPRYPSCEVVGLIDDETSKGMVQNACS